MRAVGRNLLTVGALVIVIGAGTFNVIVARRLQERFDVYLSGAEYIPPGSYVLPIFRDPGIERSSYGGGPVPGLRDFGEPFWGVTDFYAIVRGGAEPYVFAVPFVGTGATTIEFRSDVTEDYAYAHRMDDTRSFEERYRGVGDAYDYVVHFTDTPELDRVLESEIDVVFRNGAPKIYTKRAPGFGRPH